MNRLDELFAKGKKNLLNIYCTAGYPDQNSTLKVMLSLQKHGADMIEIGMPYSDPVADGPVIQNSNMKALENEMTMPLLFEQLNSIKEQLHIPVILMGYLNPVLQYGVERFCSNAAAAGVHAVILPDLPLYEYELNYKKIFDRHALHFIFLITPETSKERIKKADQLSSGFLYAVSSSSTTGNSDNNSPKEKYYKKLHSLNLKNPILIGFGINNRHSFEYACEHAAGAIIGTAYINLLAETADIDGATKTFLKGIRP